MLSLLLTSIAIKMAPKPVKPAIISAKAKGGRRGPFPSSPFIEANPLIPSTSEPKPGASLYKPVCPHPDILRIIIFLFNFVNSFGPIPHFSKVPGIKFSINTSALFTNSFKRFNPSSFFKLSAKLLLFLE